MTSIRIWGVAGALAWALVFAGLPATAQETSQEVQPTPAERAERVRERERIRKEEAAIAGQLQQAEAACYQRFAVEDCLRAERRSARAKRAVLQQREAVISDAERRERAAQRLKDVEQRQAARDAETPPAPRVAAPRKGKEPDVQAPQQRARRQSEREAAARTDQAKHRQELDSEAARNRQHQQEKQQAANERRARLKKQQEEDKARGHAPAAPLPAQ